MYSIILYIHNSEIKTMKLQYIDHLDEWVCLVAEHTSQKADQQVYTSARF